MQSHGNRSMSYIQRSARRIMLYSVLEGAIEALDNNGVLFALEVAGETPNLSLGSLIQNDCTRCALCCG